MLVSVSVAPSIGIGSAAVDVSVAVSSGGDASGSETSGAEASVVAMSSPVDVSGAVSLAALQINNPPPAARATTARARVIFADMDCERGRGRRGSRLLV